MTYQYTMCGLDYVYLLDGYRKHETKYGSGVAIEHADELDRQIAAYVILSHTRLRGQEVRFLRALMDMSQTELAAHLGMQRVSVARWEGAPKTTIPGAADRVIRMVSAKKIFDNIALLDVIVDILPEITDKDVTPIYMSYGPDRSANKNQPSFFEIKRESEGWTQKVKTG